MYAKVFTSLWDGSMRGKADEQLVFIYLLTHCDPVGEVNVLQAKIADDTGMGEVRVREAIAKLESEDASSRTPNEEGRRIVRLDDHRDWGWRVVNYLSYRSMRDAEERRRQNREAQQRRRQHKSAVSATSAHTEAEAYAEAETEAVEPTAKQKDFDSVLGSISDSFPGKVKTASKLAFREKSKDPGPKWWNSMRVQASLRTLTEGGSSMDEARMLVLAQARAEGWA